MILERERERDFAIEIAFAFAFVRKGVMETCQRWLCGPLTTTMVPTQNNTFIAFCCINIHYLALINILRLYRFRPNLQIVTEYCEISPRFLNLVRFDLV